MSLLKLGLVAQRRCSLAAHSQGRKSELVAQGLFCKDTAIIYGDSILSDPVGSQRPLISIMALEDRILTWEFHRDINIWHIVPCNHSVLTLQTLVSRPIFQTDICNGL